MDKQEVMTRLAIAVVGRVIGNAISDQLRRLWHDCREHRPKHMR